MEGPAVSVAAAIGPTFNLNSVCVKNANGTLSLDAANILILTFTFEGYNEIL